MHRNRYPEDEEYYYPPRQQQQQGISREELNRLIDAKIKQQNKQPVPAQKQTDPMILMQGMVDMAVEKKLTATPYRIINPTEANMGYVPLQPGEVEMRRSETIRQDIPQPAANKGGGSMGFEIQKLDFVWILIFMFIVIAILQGIVSG